jgi:hypothetical protein
VISDAAFTRLYSLDVVLVAFCGSTRNVLADSADAHEATQDDTMVFLCQTGPASHCSCQAGNQRGFLPVLPRNSGFTTAADRAKMGKRPGLLTPTQ